MTIENELILFLLTVAGGATTAFIYDVIRVRRRSIKASVFIFKLEDFLFWIIATLIISGIIYYGNDGEIRGFIIFGIALGAILYLMLISRWIISTLTWVINIIKRIIKIVMNTILYPFKIIMKVIYKPMRILFGFISRFQRRAIFFRQIQSYKLGLIFKRMKKTFKKI